MRRDDILQSVRKGLHHETTLTPEENYIDKVDEHILVKRVQVSLDQVIELFISKAEAVSSTVSQCHSSELHLAIKQYLGDEILSRIKVAPALEHLNWGDLPAEFGTCENNDHVAVTEALAGVAETGTLMCASSAQTPTLLNFLPETSIIVIDKMRITKTYEQAWQAINKCTPLPRAINFITGPSRTGDIEQQLLLGIHGPKKLHIIIVEKDSHDSNDN